MSKVVLIIEDEPDVLKLITNILKREDVQIMTALSGSQALDILKDVPPDIILLDLAMPGINGFDVLQVIQDTPHLSRIPVLVITARPQMAHDVQQNYEVEAIFFKPIRPVQILHTIKGYL